MAGAKVGCRLRVLQHSALAGQLKLEWVWASVFPGFLKVYPERTVEDEVCVSQGAQCRWCPGRWLELK